VSKYASLQERLIANSVLSTELFFEGTPCWIWIGKMRGSYGAITLRYKSGPRKGKVYNFTAHRLSVREFQGRRVTPKSVVLHRCNNPSCIAPLHLKLGRQAENVQQCVAQGRHKTPFRDPEKRVAL
jgi:hypothetical protein